jgi:hypothetical protein
MLVIRVSWVRPPAPYFRSKRVAPNARKLVAIFWAQFQGIRRKGRLVDPSHREGFLGRDCEAALDRDESDQLAPVGPKLARAVRLLARHGLGHARRPGEGSAIVHQCLLENAENGAKRAGRPPMIASIRRSRGGRRERPIEGCRRHPPR